MGAPFEINRAGFGGAAHFPSGCSHPRVAPARAEWYDAAVMEISALSNTILRLASPPAEASDAAPTTAEEADLGALFAAALGQEGPSAEAEFRSLAATAGHLANHLRVERSAIEQYERIGGQVKVQVAREVGATASIPAASEARATAIAALRAGLLCGALDGLIVHLADRLPADPVLEAATPELEPKLDLLTKALDRSRGVANTEWRTMEREDLELLSAFGKHENLQTADEAEALVSQENLPLLDYQSWLLATFKAGYAIGLLDATLAARKS